LVASALRQWSAAGLVLASLIFGYLGWRVWHDNPAALAAPAPSAPLREIAVRGDGVLGLAWVERTLDLRLGSPFMGLNLLELQERLQQSGQVRVAVVARRFPDVLSITLEERHPVLRVRAYADGSEVSHLFVARDGQVFSGEGYDEQTLRGMPWLDGVTLSRNLGGLGFAPVPGMESVSELLGTVRSAAPALAREFQIVSLGRFASDGVLIVRTLGVAEIVFGTRDDFFHQIARLDYILDQVRGHPGVTGLRSINLAIGGRQVPVAFMQAGDTAGASRTKPAQAAPGALARSAWNAPIEQRSAPFNFSHR